MSSKVDIIIMSLRKEIDRCPKLGATHDNKKVIVHTARERLESFGRNIRDTIHFMAAGNVYS